MILPKWHSWPERLWWRMPWRTVINSPLTAPTRSPKPCELWPAWWPILALPAVMPTFQRDMVYGESADFETAVAAVVALAARVKAG